MKPKWLRKLCLVILVPLLLTQGGKAQASPTQLSVCGVGLLLLSGLSFATSYQKANSTGRTEPSAMLDHPLLLVFESEGARQERTARADHENAHAWFEYGIYFGLLGGASLGGAALLRRLDATALDGGTPPPPVVSTVRLTGVPKDYWIYANDKELTPVAEGYVYQVRHTRSAKVKVEFLAIDPTNNVEYQFEAIFDTGTDVTVPFQEVLKHAKKVAL